MPVADFIDGCDRSLRSGTTWHVRTRPPDTAASGANTSGTVRTINRDDKGRIVEVEEHPL
jgi:hypothetical protein